MTEVSASADNGAPVLVPEEAPYTVSEAPPDFAAVEWDHAGRVISSRFTCGHCSKFRYDSGSTLYGFTYAKLAWSTIDGVNWTARDYVNDWTAAGRISVTMDGAIVIDKATVRRTLKLNGNIVDVYGDGSTLETVRDTAEPTPFDLLATATPRSAVREPQVVMESVLSLETDVSGASCSLHAAPAGSLPGGTEEVGGSRRVVAGGRRMQLDRLRVVEEEAVLSGTPQRSFVDDSKIALDGFVASSAVRLLEFAKGADALELAPFLDRLALNSHRERRVDEARVLHERALAIRARHLGPDHADTGLNLHGLGKIYFEWGRYQEAEQFLLDAVKVFEKGLRKAKFMFSAGAVPDGFVSDSLAHLVNALHTLSSLYHEQKKLQLCSHMHESAVTAVNSVPVTHRARIEAALESLAAMAVHAEVGLPTRMLPSRLR